MFENTLDLVQKYHSWALMESPAGFSGHHAVELRVRVQQLEFLHALIIEHERLQAELGFHGLAAMDNFFQLRLYVEAFYLFAWRIITITSHRAKLLPGLNFKVKGITGVRNHLIQHPEGAESQNYAQHFSFGSDIGVALKNARTPGQPTGFHDAGFRANCAEFKEALEGALVRAVT